MTVQQFDDIYDKEVGKRYTKHEIQRLSKRKNREREIGAGRHFKLDIKNRFLMLLVSLSSLYHLHFSRLSL